MLSCGHAVPVTSREKATNTETWAVMLIIQDRMNAFMYNYVLYDLVNRGQNNHIWIFPDEMQLRQRSLSEHMHWKWKLHHISDKKKKDNKNPFRSWTKQLPMEICMDFPTVFSAYISKFSLMLFSFWEYSYHCYFHHAVNSSPITNTCKHNQPAVYLATWTTSFCFCSPQKKGLQKLKNPVHKRTLG